MCGRGIDSALSTIFLFLHFGTLPTVWYFFFNLYSMDMGFFFRELDYNIIETISANTFQDLTALTRV